MILHIGVITLLLINMDKREKYQAFSVSFQKQKELCIFERIVIGTASNWQVAGIHLQHRWW